MALPNQQAVQMTTFIFPSMRSNEPQTWKVIMKLGKPDVPYVFLDGNLRESKNFLGIKSLKGERSIDGQQDTP